MPKKTLRNIDFVPNHHEYGTGRRKSVMTLSELEAMRLVDYEGMSQIEASEAMHVSRATIQRLLQSGRKTLVSSLMYKEKIMIKAEENSEGNGMKLALINEQDMVGGHIGHAPVVTLFDLEKETYVNLAPMVKGGKARAKWLHDVGATGLVVNAIGETAFKNITNLGIRIFNGTGLSVEEAILAHHSAKLESFDISKTEKKDKDHECGCGGDHDHDHECGCGGHDEEHDCGCDHEEKHHHEGGCCGGHKKHTAGKRCCEE